MSAQLSRLGEVSRWDETRGLGIVTSDGIEYVLQCTNLTDGTRTTTVGTKVSFEVQAGHGGRWQAVKVSVGLTDRAAIRD